MSIQEIKLIRPREVADLLKLNLLTVYEYIRHGKLRAAKFGRSYRIYEKDLEAFIKKHMVKSK